MVMVCGFAEWIWKCSNVSNENLEDECSLYQYHSGYTDVQPMMFQWFKKVGILQAHVEV